jgi:hypothetical protein
MGHRNDLNLRRKIAEDNRKGITINHRSTRPIKVGGKQSWLPTNLFDGKEEFSVKAFRCSYALRRVPAESSVNFFTRFRMVGEPFHSLIRARASGERRAIILA